MYQLLAFITGMLLSSMVSANFRYSSFVQKNISLCCSDLIELRAARLEAGEISKEEYDEWRYKYPESDQVSRWAKVPSQELSDMLLEEFKKQEKTDKKKKK